MKTPLEELLDLCLSLETCQGCDPRFLAIVALANEVKIQMARDAEDDARLMRDMFGDEHLYFIPA